MNFSFRLISLVFVSLDIKVPWHARVHMSIFHAMEAEQGPPSPLWGAY